MPKQIPEKALQKIEAVVAAHPKGVNIQELKLQLEGHIANRTLQYRLKQLVDQGRIVKEGEKRWTKYRLPTVEEGHQSAVSTGETAEPTLELPISKEAAEIQQYVRKPVLSRRHAGYKRSFLDQYRPNETAYLSEQERAHLAGVGSPSSGEQPAGTYAKQILNRLLIDLSWNSSRLEGNTYSLLDTKRLIDFGEEAEGKELLDAQMILNHKDAIEFLVNSANEIGFNRHTILNLHALLANNLLPDPNATGRLRQIAVGIEKSAFHPLEVPQLIEECFDQILATAEAINNPFEQAFFVMAQLPYLQPFDDVNKRVSRLAANIPLIKANYIPLSFTDVPTRTYTEAILGIYELNRVELLKDVFIWAYERSASRHAAVRQSLGEPDIFRMKHRNALRDIVQTVVFECLDRKAAFKRIATWTEQRIEINEQDQFRQVAEGEVLGLHEGNYARYQLKPSQFKKWQEVWKKPEGNNDRK
jgi:hypothetical protein